MPNRLCKNPGTASNILIRGPCGTSPYDKNLCAQICVFGTQNPLISFSRTRMITMRLPIAR